MEIEGARVLVTGGSRGLGAALGRALALAGARVVLVARGEVALREVAAGIRAEEGHAFALAADMGAKEDIHRLSGAASALVGPLDIVIHNASVLGPVPLPLLLDTECEDFSEVLEANLLGPFRLTKAVLGGMTLRGRGLVLHITSDASVNGYPGWGAYGVSKAALDQLARVWSAEVAETGVRFLSLDPGEMDTEMHAAALPDASRAGLADPARVAEAILDIVRHAERLPSGARLEVASWRLFLEAAADGLLAAART